MPHSARVLLGATTLFVFAQPALAAEEVADSGEQTIVVTGQRPEYGIKATSTATKTDTLVRDIPQAMSIVSEAQIEDQSLRSIGDLLMFVPGATPGTGESNRDQITLRGNNTTADFFVDGLRDDAQYFRDFYNLDRVEVLKGPNAMIFGRGGGGGIVNRVTKRASFGNHRQVIVSHDSEGGNRGTADLDFALGGPLGVRINSVWEDADSFRRDTRLKRYGINPTLGVAIGRATRIDVGYEYFHDRRTTDRGVPSLDGKPLKGFDRTFFGDPDDSFSDADVQIGSLAVEHGFSDALTLRHRTLLANYDKFYQNIYPNSAVTGQGGQPGLNLGAYNSRNDRRNLLSQTDLVWTGSLAGIDQTWLVGVELGRQTSRNQRLSGAIAGGNRITLADPTVDRGVVYVRAASDADNRTRTTVAAGYVQTQVRPSDFVEIVAGLRFDRFRLSVDDERAGVATVGRTDELVSPRLGLIVKPRRNLSLYGSYSRSYLPQAGDQFSGLTPVLGELKPERFDNLELGAKWEPLAGLLATAAIYQLDRSNSRVGDPARPGFFLLSGEQRTRGLELGLERSINARWQVSAGYALQDAEVTKATTACPSGDCEVPAVPRHSGSLWTKYQLSKPWALGLGVLARSKSYASISNAVELPGYARVDGAAYYRVTAGIEAQLNVENLFGVDYFPTAHNDNNIAPGAPRTARLTLRADF
ncbi:TonB-dependent receptor [Sphingomonas sp. GCM10030256]|uniref:TonB-dependent receptor n=1 Tax=Sphingomonas sp. GCM10030256 TaxID=3273427 RepID=UPI0036170F33